MRTAKAPSKPLTSTTPDGSRLPAYFTCEEIHKLLSPDLKHNDPDVYFLFDFFWRTGVRASEAITITVGDIDFSDQTIRIRSLRRSDGHVRFLPFKDDFAGEITTWIRRKRLADCDRLFPITRKTVYNWVVRACQGAGLNDGRAHPQILRHSFAVNLLSQGMPITFVQECLGHRDLSETLIYTWIVTYNRRKLFDRLKF